MFDLITFCNFDLILQGHWIIVITAIMDDMHFDKSIIEWT